MTTANDWRVADSDMHVVEPADLWERYIDPKWAHVAPIGLTQTARDMRVRVKDAILLRSGRPHPREGIGSVGGRPWRAEQDEALAASEARLFDAASQVEAMRAEGIDSTVLFPSRGLFVLGLQSADYVGPDGLEPALATAIARAYNDWMADFLKDCGLPGRTFGASMIAPHDVDGAVAELQRSVDLGFKAAFLAPGLVDAAPWHHPRYDPLWRAAEELGVAVCFHGGGRTSLLPDFSFGAHLDRLMLWHSFNQPLGIMFVAACFTSGGILARFPELRVGLLEGNCSWAPFLMYRLDEHWEWTGKYEAPGVTMKPSQYLARNCFLSCEADERASRHYVEEFGDDNVVFSTDYPHADSKFPHATETFLTLPLTNSSKKKILWDNYCKLYHVKISAQADGGEMR